MEGWWSVVGWSLNERKWSVDKCSEVRCSWVKCSESLGNRVSNIIRRYIDHMKLLLIWLFRLSHSFIFFWFHFLSLYIWFMFCTLLFNIVNCVFLLLCLGILIVTYGLFCVFRFIVLFCVLLVCRCVLYCCHRLSTQPQSTNISISICNLLWR